MSSAEVKSGVEVKSVGLVKPLVVPEKVSEQAIIDPSMLWGLPSYVVGHWVNMNNLSSNRSEYWVVIDKTHPDFKNVRVVRDDTPDNTMFTRGDLVLCCMHKDTYNQREKQKQNVVRRKTDYQEKFDKEKIERIGREGVKSLKTTLKDVNEKEKEE